jgi:hypothetical protein
MTILKKLMYAIWLSSEKALGLAATVYGDYDGLAILVLKINAPGEQVGRQVG